MHKAYREGNSLCYTNVVAYHTYTTRSYILGAAQYSEHDAIYTCITEEFGIVRARATGARKEDSKLRYSLQVGACVSLSLVQGRAGWRITGAVLIYEPSQRTITLFARLGKLAERLVHGQERNDALFDIFTACRGVSDVRSSELLLVIQMLVSLGYIPPYIIESILEKPESERVAYIESHRPILLKTVNNALHASHL